jgi:predicted DNA binding CopG/RHH family protein
MEHRKPGRPSKGHRENIRVRLPEPLAEAMRSHARRHGMTINDFLGELVAEKTGVPYISQEGLSLSA